MPGAFFSVCPSALEESHRETDTISRNFLERNGRHPQMITQIAGALKYSEYDFFKSGPS